MTELGGAPVSIQRMTRSASNPVGKGCEGNLFRGRAGALSGL